MNVCRTHIDEYNEIKGTLLLGSHVEAIANLNLCDNAQEVLPPGMRYTTAFQINRFAIRNEGTSPHNVYVPLIAL